MDQSNLAATIAQMAGMAQPGGATADMAGMTSIGLPIGNQNMAQNFFNPEAIQNDNAIALGSNNNDANKNVISLAGGGSNAAAAIPQDSAKPDGLLVSLGRDEPMDAAGNPEDNDDRLEINLEQVSEQEGREYKEDERGGGPYADDQSYQSQVDRGTSQNYNSASAYVQDEDQNQEEDLLNEQYSANAGE
jgi:hypothetical protein